MDVHHLLGELDRRLLHERPLYHSRLLPGVTETDLNRFSAEFELELPQSFRALYLWRNGQDPLFFERLVGNRCFMTLNDVIRTKKLLDDMIDSDFDEPTYWRRGWIPFLHNGGGSYLCLDLLAQDGGQPGQLVAFWKADADRPIEAASLEAWLVRLLSGDLKSQD